MDKIKSCKDLIVWQKGIDIVMETYRLTKSFPEEEKFGLTSQLRRASVSVPSNIAEGWGRGTKAHYANFLKIARGSLLEIETQLIISEKLNYTSNEKEIFQLIDEESKMLNSLIKKVEN
ncbi:MAG: four helix bundle protein [Flavobacteriales bacterium]|nr:four helix bundle protein [Flavobacteriales bacterium]